MNWQAFRLRALWCWHQLLTLGLAAIVVVAVLVAISRQLLPLMDHFRPEVESALSAQLGVPVRLERLAGEVDGTQLRVSLVRLDLLDPADRRVLLRVPEVELRPAIWQSLRHLELRVDVRLRGLQLHIDQAADGSLQLRELASLARHDAGTAEQTLRFVLRQPLLALSESRIALTLQGFPPLVMSSVEAVNHNGPNRHRLAGRVRLPGVASDLDLRLDLEGDPLRWQESRLRLWADLPVLALDAWLPALPRDDLVRHLQGGGRYWLDFRQGQLQAAQAEFDWPELDLRHDGRTHALRNVRGVLSWQRQGSGWHLAARSLRGSVDGRPWPLPQLAVRALPGSLSVAVAHANIGAAGRLLADVPLPAALAGWLQEAAPAGEVAAARADFATPADGGWQLRRLDAEVRRLTATSTDTSPGVRNLSGWVRWTPQRAWAGIDSRAAQLDLVTFREPLQLHSLRGQLRFVRGPDAWQAESDRVQVANGDARGSLLAHLSLPHGAPATGRLSLLGALADARAVSAWRYVPRSAGEQTLDWLRAGLQAGTVRRGEIAYEGPLRPLSDQDPARLLMRLDLVGGRVGYARDWPEVRDLDAVVTLDGRRLEVAATSARLLDATVAPGGVRAEIADLREPVLTVAAALASDGRDVMTLFRDSPLRTLAPGVADTLALAGPVAGRLALTVPLRGGPVGVEVGAELRDNRLDLLPAGLVATGLDGGLHYSSAEGLRASRLEARLLEAPVQADIQTRQGVRPEIIVNLTGSAEVPALRRWLASSLLDLASGAAPYQARISIPSGGSPRLQVDSSLVGMRIRLPAPFGKAPQEAVPLRYQSGLGGREQMARLQYGQRLSAGLVWQGSRLDRALFRLDSTAAAWPANRGIEVEGRLARLDLDEWRPLLAHAQRPARPATVAARGEASWPEVTRVSLDARQLLAGGWQVSDAHLALQRLPGSWQVALESAEAVGSARWPDAPGSEVAVNFSRLHWPLPAVAAAPEAGGAGLSPVEGLGNRPVLVSGDGLRLAAWPALGPLALNGRLLPIPHGVRVEGITLRSPLISFDGKLDWQWRGGVSTRLQGRAASTNVGGLLAAFGLYPGVVSRLASAELDLGWRGAPDAAAAGVLDGRLRVALEEGRLLNVSAGASASRVFGWFDLDNLRRRFKGDFSDVVKRGLVYDRISLEGALQAGVMQPASFRMTGPTLQAQGEGRVDLAQRRLDQKVTVTMPMTSAVPLAAVVMAGPVVGGAVAAAQMAFDKQIDKATQLHYHVRGEWANPQVDKLGSRTVALPVAEGGGGGRTPEGRR